MDGIEQWRKQRRELQLELARKLGLPIGQQVEVWLKSGIRLRGRLQLHDEMQVAFEENDEFKFSVQGTPFLPAEIESCARI
jgi:hypothetical protein